MAKNYISNKDETVRLFENDFLETLSRVHWSVPLLIFVPIISYFLYRAIFLFGLTFSTITIWFLIGIVVWTFTEYFLHRFVFHYQPKSEFGNRLHFLMHGVHHAYPKDSKRLVMPPSVSLPLASLFFILYLKILGYIIISPFFAGFLTGYLFYDITHYAIHHFNLHSKFWLAIKNHHAKHHYQNPELGFGVSQPVWDYVFGTDFNEEK
ncbi:MAG: sterol desaturase family protein [Stygiobacter sp.]|jgi:sterol desaturase/sphingolipid hydroxylase (fatty acid hydroxylase superfamily)|uniref:Sterol desaturase family protein n=1 Tax=Stygiobacter electus TaxID=3032292 RepID=A0AAE3TCR1_9BACT|nr:sterol desaturase family protein [Stygiobacter electus]MDF1610712.1 sterol desaturase family protein [Stygiobacter electus]